MIYKNVEFLIRFTYRKYLPLHLREAYGINALHRVKMKLISEELKRVQKLRLSSHILNHNVRKAELLKIYRRRLILLLLDVLKPGILPVKAKKDRQRKTIKKFEIEGENFSQHFRFQSGNQLRELLRCFQLPVDPIIIGSSKFYSEEILLISLKRLSYPNRWCEIESMFNDRGQKELSSAFYWFIDFMIVNWGYLILNNREYWLDSLVESAEAIRRKLATLPREGNRMYFNAADTEEGFNVALFIDNTLMAMN